MSGRGRGQGTRRARLLCACVPLHCAPVDYEISGHPAATRAINHCRPFVTDTIGLSVRVYRTIDGRVPDKTNWEKKKPTNCYLRRRTNYGSGQRLENSIRHRRGDVINCRHSAHSPQGGSVPRPYAATVYQRPFRATPPPPVYHWTAIIKCMFSADGRRRNKFQLYTQRPCVNAK